ncbi:hypothetical protein K1W69_08525 [Hoeflea sp. WL0058]|uniref:DUF1127 domain-containing protein n=1 Tax=Flavimaribacter sediminis TaxID=2865987 RepID=A0AAE2ZM63_9HYPH|nr:hypothetical protein [Flavimaribacter sediminis]MBW8637230.1 hypothetical protein [Flavimaribacter sediminis]
MHSIRDILGLRRRNAAKFNRKATRKTHGGMSELSPHLLKDIGVTKGVKDKYWCD